MSTTYVNPIKWELTRDDKSHREYKLTSLVRCSDHLDGPYTALLTPGLPQIGDPWNFGNDLDGWAFCRPNATVRPRVDKDQNKYFEIEQVFSTKPLDADRCENGNFEDPLTEPQKVSGSFTTYQEEGAYDRFGDPIMTSSFEPITGQDNQWDAGRDKVNIEQNVPALQLALCASMKHTLNDAALWGLPARCIKLSEFSWEAKFYGLCYRYYVRKFGFEVKYDTWDRDYVDRGTKALRGRWQKDPASAFYRQYVLADNVSANNPTHFDRYKDWNGENVSVILNGAGVPYDPGQGSVTGTGTGDDTVMGSIHVEYYDESNFLLLGIPTTF